MGAIVHRGSGGSSMSANNTPFNDKKLNKPLLKVVNGSVSCQNTPKIRPKAFRPPTGNSHVASSQVALISPTLSEHQYDIPFSHLGSQCVVGEATSQPLHKSPRHSGNASNGEAANRMTSFGASNSSWGGNTLLQPRVIDGNSALMRQWSGSEKSFDTSIYSETSRPESSCFNADYRNSLASCTFDPESFTFATVTSAGKHITLPDLGVSLNIPEGALDKGYSEEVFLAVMTEGKDRPRLSSSQALLSPVVLIGPPRLVFKKPVVLSFDHCANLNPENGWEMGLYHCDSLFTELDETPWVKLTTLCSKETDSSSVLANLDNNSCQVMTEFLSRFCIVGQSENLQDTPATKLVRTLIFGRFEASPNSSSSSGSLGSSQDSLAICVQAADDTRASVGQAIREQIKKGWTFLTESPKSCKFSERMGSGLQIILSDSSTGWSLRSNKKSMVDFHHVWSGSGSKFGVKYHFQHVDPTVRTLSFNISSIQEPDNKQGFKVHVDPNGLTNSGCSMGIMTATVASVGSGNSSSSPLRRNYKTSTAFYNPPPLTNGTRASSNSSSSASTSAGRNRQAFKVPTTLKFRLCKALDSPQSKGQNDWRALAAGLRFEKYSGYFASKQSPTECVLNLWEAQQQCTTANPLADLCGILCTIGREDLASMFEVQNH